MKTKKPKCPYAEKKGKNDTNLSSIRIRSGADCNHNIFLNPGRDMGSSGFASDCDD